jgi:hydrogenase expression/formation protein HypD
LAETRARGADIRIVYSPLEALDISRQQNDKDVVFAAVGFETTLPGIAATVLQAAEANVGNLSILTAGRLALPAMSALLRTPEVKIDGFICPGHVSIVTGSSAYQSIADDFHVPCVIAGFEADDILRAIVMLLHQISEGRSEVENEYDRVVRPEGNQQAQSLMSRVFDVVDAEWRGIGVIPESGVALKASFSSFDAAMRFQLEIPVGSAQPAGCSCGEVMRGLMLPNECPLFGQSCIPARPVGPCMVSSEGACAAYFNYGIRSHGRTHD